MSFIPSAKFNTLIFDIGDVLCTYSPSTTNRTVSPKLFKSILSSSIWLEYERGKLSEDNCYDRVAATFDIDVEQLQLAIRQVRESITFMDAMTSLIHDIKRQSLGHLRLFAMSNISSADFEYASTKFDFSVFDGVYTSCAAGNRKPDLEFYNHVLSEIGGDPHSMIFVDDKVENVLSACSFGIHGIVFDNPDNVRRILYNLLGDPVARARKYLKENAGRLDTVTATGSTLNENISQLLILEITGDRDLIQLANHSRIWNFFYGKSSALATFPCDLGTTSLALTTLKLTRDIVLSVMEEMLEYLSIDGIILTYFDHNRPYFDPVVCVNVLHLFYSHGQGHRLKCTLTWVYNVLLNRAYMHGTRFYDGPEPFLYFLVRLLRAVDDAELHNLLSPLLKDRIQELVGLSGNAISYAMRIIICDFVGIRDEPDLRALLTLQCEDGGWEMGWMYKDVKTGVKLGNRGLTTALAINAIYMMMGRENNVSKHRLI